MIIRNKTCFVFDVESFPNFFCVVVKNTESKNIKSFEISSRRNDLPDIVKLFLNRKIYWVGLKKIGNLKFY